MSNNQIYDSSFITKIKNDTTIATHFSRTFQPSHTLLLSKQGCMYT